MNRHLTKLNTFKPQKTVLGKYEETVHDLKNMHRISVQPEMDAVLSKYEPVELSQLLIKSINNPLRLIREYMKLPQRNTEESWHLLQLLRNTRFFRQYMHRLAEREELDVLIDICKRIKYIKVPEDTIVIKQGDISDGNVYLVLTGDLNIFVRDAVTLSDTAHIKFVQNEGDSPDSPHILNRQLEKVKSGTRSRRGSRASIMGDVPGSPGRKLSKFLGSSSNSPGGSPDDSFSSDFSEPQPNQRAKSRFANDTPRESLVGEKKAPPSNFLLQLRSMEDPRPSMVQNQNQEGGRPSLFQNSNPPEQQLVANRPIVIRKINKDENKQDSRRESLGIQPNSPGLRPRGMSFNEKDKEKNKDSNVFEQAKGSNEMTVVKNKYGIMVDKIYEGSFFGERAPRGHRRRATCVSIGKLELLVISADDYGLIKTKYDKNRLPYFDFVRKCFGLGENEPGFVIDAVTYVLELKEYKQGDTVCTQGEKGSDLYLIFEGECEVRKTVIFDNTENTKMDSIALKGLYRSQHKHKEDFKLSNLNKGSYFGLELIGNENGDNETYEYTVRVISLEARILAFKRNKVKVRFPQKIIDILLKVYAQTKTEYSQLLLKRIETRTKILGLNDGQVYPIVKTVSPRKKNPFQLQFTGFTEIGSPDESPVPNSPTRILPRKFSQQDEFPSPTQKIIRPYPKSPTMMESPFSFPLENKRTSLPAINSEGKMEPMLTPEPWSVKTPPLTLNSLRRQSELLETLQPELLTAQPITEYKTPRIALKKKFKDPVKTDPQVGRSNSDYIHYIEQMKEQKRFGFIEEAAANPDKYVNNIQNFKLGIEVSEKILRKYEQMRVLETNKEKEKEKGSLVYQGSKESPTQIKLRKMNAKYSSETSLLNPTMTLNSMNSALYTLGSTIDYEVTNLKPSILTNSHPSIIEMNPKKNPVRLVTYMIEGDTTAKVRPIKSKQIDDVVPKSVKAGTINNLQLNKIQKILAKANLIANQTGYQS